MGLHQLLCRVGRCRRAADGPSDWRARPAEHDANGETPLTRRCPLAKSPTLPHGAAIRKAKSSAAARLWSQSPASVAAVTSSRVEKHHAARRVSRAIWRRVIAVWRSPPLSVVLLSPLAGLLYRASEVDRHPPCLVQPCSDDSLTGSSKPGCTLHTTATRRSNRRRCAALRTRPTSPRRVNRVTCALQLRRSRSRRTAGGALE